MDRIDHTTDSSRRHRNGSSGGGGSSGMFGVVGAGSSGNGSRNCRRYSRSRTRSRERSREQNFRRRSSRSRSRDKEFRNRHNTRSRSRERMPQHYRRGAGDKDLYRDLIYDDYQEERDRKDYRYSRYGGGGNRRYNTDRDRDSDESDESYFNHYYNKTPSNTIIVMGLQPHITEADITSALIQLNMIATSIRLIRKRHTGASRGFAFVEFNSVDEAALWMDLTQGVLVLQDQTRAWLQYSQSREQNGAKMHQNATDWYCGKCGVFNFKRRDSCFKCYASREESEKGGEGSDEVSNILTKKIMLRNLDALTNEESVLNAMQQHAPDLAKKISKILISRDALTQTSRGICYLNFESLVDSMNLYNVLIALDPALKIDNRDVLITYCIDHENRYLQQQQQQLQQHQQQLHEHQQSMADGLIGVAPPPPVIGGGGGAALLGPLPDPMGATEKTAPSVISDGRGDVDCATALLPGGSGAGDQYTLADVPRLAEYSAAMYASTPAEHAHYLQYYTDYYVGEIGKGGIEQGALQGTAPAVVAATEASANSGAAVALSAIQRKQKKMSSIETTATQAAAAAAAAAAHVKALMVAQTLVTPKGNDGRTYPPPDISLYQYDETSGYYYDPSTGLYYDAHSQYYYNNETGAYLYWDQRRSTYVLATPAAAAASVQDVLKQEAASDEATKPVPTTASNAGDDEAKKEKKDGGASGGKHDKVKVAKKIVKDMEKWAKQLNQKKDYTVVATPQPILPCRGDEQAARTQSSSAGLPSSSGYADVGFSILEKKERNKFSDYVQASAGGAPTAGCNKLVNAYASDSDDEHVAGPPSSIGSSGSGSVAGAGDPGEKDCVNFQKLTCLLCKRAFQSLDILQKHLKMSNLHKENLQKFNVAQGLLGDTDDSAAAAAALSYRDRAKERRLKYGEFDPPPPNRSRERFESEIKTMASRKPAEAPALPIGSNNVGNRLLQKMGWSEGQGLGRKNQGRTNIIEANARSSNAGLGTKAGITPGDDYKTYIKKMMKSRYESV